MSDIATLGIRVDPKDGISGLKQFDAEVKRTAASVPESTKKMVQQTERVLRDSAQTQRGIALVNGRDQAKALADAMDRQFKADMARIKDGQARGFLTKAQAQQAGREAAQAYNRGVISAIDKGSAAGVFRGAAGQEQFTKLAGSLKNVDVAGKSAGVTMNSLRSGVTTFAAGALSAAPGVAQLGSTIGALAIGSTMMIGVLAGVAALGYGWQKLSEHARELREAAEGARAAIARIGTTASTALVEHQKALNAENEALDQRNKRGRTLLQILSAVPGMYEAVNTRIAANTNLFGQNTKAIQKAGDELDRLRAEGLERQKEEQEKAARAAADARDRAFREEMEAYDAHYRARMELEKRWENIRRTTLSQPPIAGATGQGWQGAALPRPVGLNQQMDDVRKDLGIGGQPSFLRGLFGGLKESISSMFNPTRLLTGLATGGISTLLNGVVNGLTGLVGGLFDGGKAAREFARQMRAAQNEFINNSRDSLERLQAQAKGGDAVEQYDAAASVRAQIDEFLQKFNIKGGGPASGLDLAGLREWLKNLTVPGGFNSKQFEAWELILATIDARQAILDMADAASKATEALTNLPAGFKIALERFRASEGAADPRATTAAYRAPMSRGDTYQVTIVQRPGQDGKVLWNQMQKEAKRAKQLGGFSRIAIN